MSEKFSLKGKTFIKLAIAVSVSLICLLYVVSIFDWREIWKSLQKADTIRFFLGTVLNLLAYFYLRSVRWYLLLKSENLNVPFLKLYLYNSVSIGLSTITPFQSGEAVKVEFLRNYGGKRLSGYTIFVLERLLDLLMVSGLAITGAFFGFDFGLPLYYFYLAAAAVIVLFLTGVGIIFLLPSARIISLKELLRGKWREKWTILAAMILTAAAWLVIVFGWKNALASVSVEIDFLPSVSLVALTTLLAIISFVPGAVGVSEISISTILIKMGVASSSAQTGAIAIRGYALVILILTLLHWIILKATSKK